MLIVGCGCALAQPIEPTRTTIDLVASRGSLTSGLPDATALNLRGTWDLPGGDVLRAEGLDERKFASRGGIGAIGYTKVLSPDWAVAGTLALGHGGINWARQRVDVEASTKWGQSRAIVTRVALYHAAFDGARSDRGLRLGVVAYVGVVLEAGVTLNVSNPGSVHSQMPFVSATVGSDGDQYFSLRASAGSEAYQAIGAGQQLVDFNSRSLGVNWRRWIDRRWGLTVQAERYHNPTYNRTTLGAGLFAQW